MDAEYRARHAVRQDRWDKADLKSAKADVELFRRARTRLRRRVEHGPEAMEDTFFLLHQADPHLLSPTQMRPTHRVNHTVATEMRELSTLERLRKLTVGDAMQSALAAADLGPHLEGIFEHLELADKLARELEDALARAREAAQALREAQAEVDRLSGELTEADLERALEAAERLADAQAAQEMAEEAVSAAEAALSEALADAAPLVGVSLGEAMSQTLADTAASVGTAAAWGAGQGELRRMSPTERLNLARQLNTARMRAIADLFGRIRNLSLSLISDTGESFDEIVDLTLGGDLDLVAPSELLELAHADTELHFLARWADQELLSYDVSGADDLGRGAIICVVDGTGSMQRGDRETFAKAVMLVLLHQARAQRRAMHVIIFGWHQLAEFPFTSPAEFTPERIIDAASCYFGYGTDFLDPMNRALELLDAEFSTTGRTTADVVFITDDECMVPDADMTHYLDEMHRMGARTWGVAVDSFVDERGPLHQMSEGRVMTVHDLTSGRDIAPLLLGLR